MGVCILAKRVVLELSSSTNFVYSLRLMKFFISLYFSCSFFKITLYSMSGNKLSGRL